MKDRGNGHAGGHHRSGKRRLWAAGEEIKPVGRGTANEYEPGDLFWIGAFGIPGEYYIVAENASSGDASLQLNTTSGDASP